MAEIKDLDHHLIEIPVTGDDQKQLISAIKNHPSTEISQSPGHLLLLKLLQREEHLSGCRIARKETRLDTLRREIFQLCLFFFTFHGLFLTILFTSSSNVCEKWWIPMISSLSFCLVMVLLVQMKLFRFWKVCEQIQREKTDNRGLMRCIRELRSKGVGFDLSKEPGNGKRIKSSSVEIKWKPVTWCTKYFVTICLVSASGLVLPVCKFVVCG
ncbi:hypothetical protein QVD17_05995 [Tagetes erecta]|uniref:Uncharacterized protein n=1 Tax=Tagetes erecta TaxID=13708 RepID=A0AAD8LML9_TARER|nr:hypothetical protein QVD17_05995 [Tagetes erecta]